MADYEAVLALWQAMAGVGLSQADTRPAIARFLERNPGLSFIAQAGPSVIGVVLGGHDGRRGYLHHLAVSPAYRRQGLGQALVERCLAGLNAQGIDKCHLFVFTGNEAAQAFWRDTGWQERSDLIVFSQTLIGSY